MTNISGLGSYTQKFPENRVRAKGATRKRQVAPEHLLQTHSTFSKSVMMAVGTSKVGRVNLILHRCQSEDQWRILP